MTTFLLRGIRVVLVTVLCVFIFCGLLEFFRSIGMLVSAPEQPGLNPIQALFGGAIFSAPFFLVFVTGPLLLILAATEWKGMTAWRGYLIIWTVVMLVPSPRIAAGAGLVLTVISTVLAAAAVSGIYWFLAGRSAGATPRFVTRQTPRRVDVLRYLSYAVVAFLGYQLSGYVWHGAKLVYVKVYEPGRGTPEFQSRHQQLTGSEKVALLDFPDVESCLKPADSADPADRLKRIDWDKIDTTAEAEVCMFRLLASYGDISRATEWLEAQGFESGRHFTSSNPESDSSGRKGVHATWNIRKKGPKIPTSGFIRRTFFKIPYSMGVYTVWSEDGRRLLSVHCGYNTL